MNDIKSLLTDALIILGSDMNRFKPFDAHSTIALSFENIGDIYIETIDGQLWIWNEIADTRIQDMVVGAHDILIEVTRPTDYALGGCLILCDNEKGVHLRAIVRSDYLDNASHFAAAIEGFFLRTTRIRELVR
jgi:type III secretion system chaperone